MSENSINVTKAAKQHFLRLVRQEQAKTHLKIKVENPLTSSAKVDICYCPEKLIKSDDDVINCGEFNFYIDKDSVNALKDAFIDYVDNLTNGEVTIKAPNIYGVTFAEDAPLAEKINYVIDTEIAPNLASHGGYVNLVEVLEGGVVQLRFGGGCQGCGMSKFTLKQGIESILLDKFPKEVTKVVDITEHQLGTNPYYQGVKSE